MKCSNQNSEISCPHNRKKIMSQDIVIHILYSEQTTSRNAYRKPIKNPFS